MVHVHLGEDAGDCEGVGYIGFATAAQLPVVGLFCKVVGALDVNSLVRAEVAVERRIQGVDGLHSK